MIPTKTDFWGGVFYIIHCIAHRRLRYAPLRIKENPTTLGMKKKKTILA